MPFFSTAAIDSSRWRTHDGSTPDRKAIAPRNPTHLAHLCRTRRSSRWADVAYGALCRFSAAGDDEPLAVRRGPAAEKRQVTNATNLHICLHRAVVPAPPMKEADWRDRIRDNYARGRPTPENRPFPLISPRSSSLPSRGLATTEFVQADFHSVCGRSTPGGRPSRRCAPPHFPLCSTLRHHPAPLSAPDGMRAVVKAGCTGGALKNPLKY
jgi:hypothetical protein